MANEKQKQKKKKERERKNQQAVAKARAFRTQADKEVNDFMKAQKAFKRAEKDRKRMEAWAEKFMNNLDPETRAQVKANIEKLQNLEDEYSKEMIIKKKLNEMLEGEGAVTMEEKLAKLKTVSDQNAVTEKNGLVSDSSFGPET
jgi:formate dehydrogenase maturation protein FdhE